MKRATPAGVLALAFSAQWPVTVHAAHPLLTEDTGTQGAGHYQLELTHDLASDRAAGTKTRSRSANAALTAGLSDALDVIVALPHERLTERTGAAQTTMSGFADMEIAAKWRFYEAGVLSFALRPGLGLPTGNEDEGLSTGHVTPPCSPYRRTPAIPGPFICTSAIPSTPILARTNAAISTMPRLPPNTA